MAPAYISFHDMFSSPTAANSLMPNDRFTVRGRSTNSMEVATMVGNKDGNSSYSVTKKVM